MTAFAPHARSAAEEFPRQIARLGPRRVICLAGSSQPNAALSEVLISIEYVKPEANNNCRVL